MASSYQLSLFNAVLINLNIMMGTGIFINTVELAKRTGLISAFMYPLIGIFIAPLIVAIAHLVKLYPVGGFYTFAYKEISPFMGFFNTWCYFIAKLASASLMIHVSVSLFLQIFPFLATLAAPLVFDIGILTLFIGLNLCNMRTGSTIQMGFLFFKLIPILFVIATGFLMFSPASSTRLPLLWTGIPTALPLVLYAAMGFEAICSLSNKIENPERNGPKAILYSFLIMMCLVFLFQLFFCTTVGNALVEQRNFLGAFPALLAKLWPASTGAHMLTALFHIAIASSALGGCYGILFSNCWNLYTIAQDRHMYGWQALITLNKHAIPWVCLSVEWLICCIYLLATRGNQITLQQSAALGTVISYSICVVALYIHQKKQGTRSFFIPATASISCCLLLGACMRNFIIGGIIPLMGFLGLLSVGLLLYRRKS